MPVSGYILARDAKKYIGTPYVWGGNDLKNGVDCSGLVQQVYRQRGIAVPRVTYDQIKVGMQVAYEDLQPGDMVFFDTDRSVEGPDHVGLYVGDGQFIHAPKPGEKVQISDMTTDYYANRYMGGRRHGGIIGGGQYRPGSSAAGVDTAALSDEQLAADYGFSYAYLTHNPELKSVFEQAVDETWAQPKFMAAVRNTSWWQENSESRRQAQMLEFSDPSTFDARLRATSVHIRDLANQIGALVSDKTISNLADQMVRTEMGDEQLTDILSRYIDFTKEGTLAGEAGLAVQRVREVAHKNGVRLSDNAIKNYAQNIMMGNTTVEQWEQFIRQQAASMFPGYEEQLAAGQNMDDIAAPYVDQMAADLEINPASLNMFDPTIQEGLNGLNADGKPTGMTLSEFQDHIRQDPRWLRTNNARDRTMTVATGVLNDLGIA